MRIAIVSDTHGWNQRLQVPGADLFLHAGDLTRRGTEGEIRQALDWIASLPHRHKVFIAGNHDFLFEDDPERARALVPPGVVYLDDSGTEIEGLRIWGSPVQPRFFDWAFNRDRGADIRRHWDLIPERTDLLVTHGPPLGILDRTARGPNVGCEELLERLAATEVRLHVFGHIHEARGIAEEEIAGRRRLFCNACSLTLGYQPHESTSYVFDTERWEFTGS
jgi:Icc-related predicted phosphoesterase